jgi:hypothetical protein
MSHFADVVSDTSFQCKTYPIVIDVLPLLIYYAGSFRSNVYICISNVYPMYIMCISNVYPMYTYPMI